MPTVSLQQMYKHFRAKRIIKFDCLSFKKNYKKMRNSVCISLSKHSLINVAVSKPQLLDFYVSIFFKG